MAECASPTRHTPASSTSAHVDFQLQLHVVKHKKLLRLKIHPGIRKQIENHKLLEALNTKAGCSPPGWPAGRPASVNTFEKHSGEQKRKKRWPAGRLRPKGERGGRVQVRAFPFAWLRSLVKNTLFDKIENCKNCIGKSIGTIYIFPD